MLIAALVLGLGGRIAYSYNAPLWFDETFTGVIASQTTLGALLKWCLNELTGPAYYVPLWLWEKVAGTSNIALRLPSLVLSLGTPLAVLAWGHRAADLRLWWAVVLLLWVPIFAVAGEARAYPEIFALGTLQAALFVRLIERPSTARASGWIIASSLLVLCNYWGGIPALVQGLVFIAVHRTRAIRTWPALLFMAPMLAWSWFHLPAVLAFTVGGSSGISGLPLSAVLDIPAMLFGVGLNGAIVMAMVIGSLGFVWLRGGLRLSTPPTPERALALCGAASVAVILVMAFVKPGFSPRYATAAMPSFLFGLALWVRWMMARDARPVVLAVVLLFATAAGLVGSILRGPDTDPRHKFELERPSAWLAEHRPDSLVVFWDGPVAEASPDFALAEVGGFFLRRAGHGTEVAVARVPAAENPNPAVLARADGNSAILWFANDELPASRAPHIERYDSRFECRDFGGGVVTMIACRQRR